MGGQELSVAHIYVQSGRAKIFNICELSVAHLFRLYGVTWPPALVIDVVNHLDECACKHLPALLGSAANNTYTISIFLSDTNMDSNVLECEYKMNGLDSNSHLEIYLAQLISCAYLFARSFERTISLNKSGLKYEYIKLSLANKLLN